MRSESMFVICGEGYNGVADTLDEAHALALRMGGGTVYVRVALVEHILHGMNTILDKAHRIAVLEAALNDLLIGAEQQSQSHVDVIGKVRAALDEDRDGR